MKVLIVFNHPAPYKVKLFNEICKFIDLDVIFERTYASDRPKEFYSENEYNFNVTFLKKGAFGAENSNTKELVNYIKNHHKEYDLIIMNGYSTITELRAIRYMNKHHIPFTLYINGGVIKKENCLKRRFKKKIISSASKYLSPCLEANAYLEFYGANKDNIYIYPYSNFFEKEILPKPLTKEDKLLKREKYNLPKDRLFVSAAQFIERKNNLQLIKIFSKLDEHLLLIGRGPQKEIYEKYILENNIKNVHLMDFLDRERLFEIMRCCDGFITLSKQDIYGHTTAEAMANGLPVISSDKVVASLNLIKNGYNGYIISIDNEQKILDAIKSVSENMSINSINTAKENTIEAMAKAHEEIFKRIK